MELSARNQIPGTVRSVKLGAIMAEVVPAITRSSVERLAI